MLVSWDVGKAGCSADLIVSEPEAERLFHLKPDLVLLFKTSYLTVLPLQATNTSQSSNAVLYGCTVSVCVEKVYVGSFMWEWGYDVCMGHGFVQTACLITMTSDLLEDC